jgi:hypothetical protein
VRIWTIQPAGLYETLKAKRVLLADGRRRDRMWDHAYRWMTDQMRRRLPPSRARFPWWGWYRWEGTRRARPDLRAGGHLRKGQRGVRLELEIAAERVLLSDFEKWHFVLSNWYLSEDEADDDQFSRQTKQAGHRHDDRWPEPLRSKVLASWERIFDLTAGAPGWFAKTSTRSIQATFWELRYRDVRDVTHFTPR